MESKRILIVDDEIGSTRLLKENLESTNLYKVRAENRPENAVSVARQFKPHLVLLDLVMPHMSGTAVAEALLSDPGLKSVAIAFLTAADSSLLPADAGPTLERLPRIVKPAGMEQILDFLGKTLSRMPNAGCDEPANSAELPGGNHE